jgi:hypothetical protein
MMFEQSLAHFKKQHPGLPILILVPVIHSAEIISDMTDQLIKVAQLLGESRVLLTIAMGETEEFEDTQLLETSRILHSSKILHRIQYTNDVDTWIERALFGYMMDFEVAAIVQGVVCASDLVRLITQTVDNGADMACAVDISFASNRLVVTHEGNIDLHTNEPISSRTLIRSPRCIQARCCDSSVKVVRLRSLQPTGPLPYDCPQILHNDLQSTLVNPDSLDRGSRYTPKIMISPSVKTSSNPEDFRSAMQLGFMDLQGYDYRNIEWE